MAEALKTFFSRGLVVRIAASFTAVHPAFPAPAFIRDATRGLEDLELLARARHVTAAMARHLPPRYPDAIGVIVRSLGPVHATDELEGVGMAPFFYLPHVYFVATHGLDHFDLSMRAQHALTQRFTCEWSIRPFLERHPEATLETLDAWSRDASPHVRRLVSEGTRPLLPWAPRVGWLVSEPERVLGLLERLKDDPASAVRRSVANHLNDLSKAHPRLACDVAERWLDGASEERRALVKHALRTCVKRGDARALGLLGFGGAPVVDVTNVVFAPKRVRIGGSVRVSFDVVSTSKRSQSLAVDLVVGFVKARGQTSAKVFKVGTATLGARERASFAKRVSVAVHTTRTPYPGRHVVEAAINGERRALGAFVVTS